MARKTLLLLVLVGALCICVSEHSRKKTGSSKKKTQLQENNDEIEDIPVLQLDKELQEEIKNPTPPQQSSEVQLKIFTNMVNFLNRLKHLHEGILKDTTSKLNVAYMFLAKNGSDFLKEEINEESLRKTYNWDSEHLAFFRDYLVNIKGVWNNITSVLKNKPKPLDIYTDDRKRAYISKL